MTERTTSGTRRVTLLDGRLTLEERASGPLTTSDSVALTTFAATVRRRRTVLDLGAGAGPVGLSLAMLGGAERVILLEAAADLTPLARRNALAVTGAAARVDVIEARLPPLPAPLHGVADLVVCNPPYHEAGRESPDGARRAARHGPLAPFLEATTAALASPRSRACFIYPAERLQPFLVAAASHGLAAKRLRLITGRDGRPADRALLELCRGRPGGLRVEP